jgi:hypothetical protein
VLLNTALLLGMALSNSLDDIDLNSLRVRELSHKTMMHKKARVASSIDMP